MSLEARKEQIDKDIKANKIILFMKGDKDAPQCGFSAQVVHILSDLNLDFTTQNVLADEDLRQGIKEYSDWPTIPQLYVDGEFIGGCDIITEMFQSGELEKLVNA